MKVFLYILKIYFYWSFLINCDVYSYSLKLFFVTFDLCVSSLPIYWRTAVDVFKNKLKHTIFSVFGALSTVWRKGLFNYIDSFFFARKRWKLHPDPVLKVKTLKREHYKSWFSTFKVECMWKRKFEQEFIFSKIWDDGFMKKIC